MESGDRGWPLNIVAPSYDPATVGGAGEVMMALVDQFIQLHPNVRICLNPVAAARFPQWQSRIVEIPAFSMRGNRNKSLALLRLAAFGSAALPADGVFWFPFGVMLPFNFRGRGVVTLHDTLERDLPRAVGIAERLFRAVMIPRTLHRCRAVTVSRFSRDRIRHHHRVEAKVIPHAPLVMPEPSGERPLRTPYAFYPANSWPHKNHTFLLELWESHPELQDLTLVFTMGNGMGSMSRPVERARARGADVVITGRVTREDLSTWYRHAVCTLVPSLYEGFGLPVQEALSLGCPVLAGDCGGVEEIVGKDSPWILAFEPAAWVNAIAALRSGSMECPAPAKRTWRTCGEKYLEEFQAAAA